MKLYVTLGKFDLVAAFSEKYRAKVKVISM